MTSMRPTLLVAAGGLVGSVARYWLAGMAQQLGSTSFPIGTLVVNVLGSFTAGVVMASSLERGLLGVDARLLLATGFCGGFTTMSTFSYETMALVRDGQLAFALGNLAFTIVVCLAAVWIGLWLGRGGSA
jgi:CrcB protein